MYAHSADDEKPAVSKRSDDMDSKQDRQVCLVKAVARWSGQTWGVDPAYVPEDIEGESPGRWFLDGSPELARFIEENTGFSGCVEQSVDIAEKMNVDPSEAAKILAATS